KNTYYYPSIENVFGVFKYIKLEDIKVVMVGDKPYEKQYDICDIAFGTKNNEPPVLLERIYANLESTVKSFKRPLNHHLDKWLNNGIFLCNFCFTQTSNNFSYDHYLLWEPFINNLVEYISNDHPVIFMLFGSKAISVRKSINEIKSSVIEIPHP
ncbi:DNA glycosylase, partial [Piromyces finnis]